MDVDDYDDEDDAPSQIRSEDAQLFITDIEVGWADIMIIVGPHDCTYVFSLVTDPLGSIRRFEKDLSDGKASRMLLPGEPGGVEIVADLDEPDGWVRLQAWKIDYRDERALEFEAYCPAETLAQSMRKNVGFLAKDYGLEPAEQVQSKSFWKKVSDWLIEH